MRQVDRLLGRQLVRVVKIVILRGLFTLCAIKALHLCRMVSVDPLLLRVSGSRLLLLLGDDVAVLHELADVVHTSLDVLVAASHDALA